jgi:type II restriction/modification system DNA methylase subunit YeeA
MIPLFDSWTFMHVHANLDYIYIYMPKNNHNVVGADCNKNPREGSSMEKECFTVHLNSKATVFALPKKGYYDLFF